MYLWTAPRSCPRPVHGGDHHHHPQAVYFGMKSGFIPKEKAPDELITAQSAAGPCLPRWSPPRALSRMRASAARRTKFRPSRSPSRLVEHEHRGESP